MLYQQLPLSLYIHFPWCIRKCPYCDFNSHTLRNELPEENYINALLADLDADLPQINSRPIISIFMGGGTPSLFSPQAMAQLLAEIQKRLIFTSDIEITLEANPGTVEYQRFAGYRSAGINRLSIGIQSFQAEKLTALGRIHNDEEAKIAAETAHATGFDNFNLDLMFGLPKQTISDALFDLETAVSLKPTHISWYQLTIEPNTFFAHSPPVLPQDEMIWTMQEQGQALLAENNYKQYEISAYSQPGKQCRHNRNYWRFGDYLGIGAGAHSKITDIEKQTIKRFWKLKNPKDYLDSEKAFIGEEKIITSSELPFEFMLNSLRLYEAISIKLFEEHTGLKIAVIEKALTKAINKGLIRWSSEVIETTELGKRFYNDLVEVFM